MVHLLPSLSTLCAGHGKLERSCDTDLLSALKPLQADSSCCSPASSTHFWRPALTQAQSPLNSPQHWPEKCTGLTPRWVWWLVPAVCCPPGCDGFVRTNKQKPEWDTASTLAGRYRTEAVTLSKGESLLCAKCSSSGSSQTWLTGCVSQEPVPVGTTDQQRRHREFGCASMC